MPRFTLDRTQTILDHPHPFGPLGVPHSREAGAIVTGDHQSGRGRRFAHVKKPIRPGPRATRRLVFCRLCGRDVA